MSDATKADLVTAARSLFDNIQLDLVNATTRIEHMRITRLAQEAENLYLRVLDFQCDQS